MLNQPSAPSAPISPSTLRTFTEAIFIPLRSPRWSPATRQHNLDALKRYIYPFLGDTPLVEIQPIQVAGVLAHWATHCSRETVRPIRTLLRAILSEAQYEGLIIRSPGERVPMPRCKENSKPYIEPEQLRQLLEHIDFKYRMLLEVGAFGALTSSELFALTWQRYSNGTVHIRDSVYQGTIQWNSTKNSERRNTVTLPSAVTERLEVWRRLTERRLRRPVAPTQLIFPSRSGTPLEMRNVWRSIQPIAQELGITNNISLQLLRRSFATNAQSVGSMKDVQAHMRHATISTTANVYMQKRPESVKSMVEGLYGQVYGLREVA